MMKHLVCTVYSFTGKSLIVLTSQVLKITLSTILKKNKFWSFWQKCHFGESVHFGEIVIFGYCKTVRYFGSLLTCGQIINFMLRLSNMTL